MPVVQDNPGNPGTFRLDLPDPPSDRQAELKQKIEAAQQELSRRQADTRRPGWSAQLREIAVAGFDGTGGAAADPDAAIGRIEALVTEITRPDPDPPPVSRGRPGPFRVTLPEPADRDISWRDLVFNIHPDIDPTPEQLQLKAEIESTLTTLMVIFPDDGGLARPPNPSTHQRRYSEYQIKLLGVAQIGLQTPARPELGRMSLLALQDEIRLREGPRIKNKYMKSLGAAAAGMAIVSAIGYLMLRNNPHFSVLLYAFRNLLVVWTGTMIGTWLSFGIRRPILAFKDLGALETDMVEPAVRLIFTGLIAVTIAFIFICGMVTVQIGGLDSANLIKSGAPALLIGILLGVSEQSLPNALTRRASQFVSEVGGR